MLSSLFLLLWSFAGCLESKPNYCIPANSNCWPTQSEIDQFGSQIYGQFITKSLNATKYGIYVNMTQNLLYRNQYPSFFVICKNVSDIQSSILFASKHNIQISILSTGHSWSGVSTANNSLQINLSQMKKYEINNISNTITVETGLQWGDIYKIADDLGHKIIIGGADSSVGPGGYSLGGGHSPISPAFGLSSDFITELYMVDANGNIIHVYNTSGINQTIDDLFWSLRGGGGGTFGVVVNITFLLHDDDMKKDDISDNDDDGDSIFTVIECDYSFYQYPLIRDNNILSAILNNFWNLLITQQLDNEWGGYLMVPLSDLEQNILQIALIYYGNKDYAVNNSEPILHLNKPYNNDFNFNCSYSFFDTFYQFISQIPSFKNGIVYANVFNDLVPLQNLTNDLSQTMVDFFNSSHFLKDGYIRTMTSVLIGGEIHSKNDDFTSVHPAWRHCAMELGFSFFWSDNSNTDNVIKHSNEWQSKFWKYGFGNYGAIYSNEQDFQCDNCNWQQMFWGNDHYNKLLNVKKLWDPSQVFWCHHCVEP